jgi:hypothetical protein
MNKNNWKLDNRTGAMKLEAEIAVALGFTHNEHQAGGLTPDFTCSEGHTYEFKKLDRKPYIELASSWDYKKTWKTTGIPVQAGICDYFLFLIPGRRLVKVPSSMLTTAIESDKWEQWCTSPNANGNRDGHFSRGVYIPYDVLTGLPGATVIELPEGVASDPRSAKYGPRAMEATKYV